jgi:hypothetical protein
MFTAYIVVTLLAVVANTYAATADFSRAGWIVDSMTKLNVPHSWMIPLGALKAAGALGLLVGLGVPIVGIAASVGLVLFFVCANVAHIRAHWYSVFPVMFLLLAAGSLGLRLASA